MESIYVCDSTLKGHTHFVHLVAFNHDGTKIASSDEHQSVECQYGRMHYPWVIQIMSYQSHSTTTAPRLHRVT